VAKNTGGFRFVALLIGSIVGLCVIVVLGLFAYLRSIELGEASLVVSKTSPRTIGHYTDNPELVFEASVKNTGDELILVFGDTFEGEDVGEMRLADDQNNPVGSSWPVQKELHPLQPGESMRAVAKTGIFLRGDSAIGTVRFLGARGSAMRGLGITAVHPREVSERVEYHLPGH